jgi:hypothetical protein
VEHDVLEKRALPVHTRFELAIRRMTEAWLAAGRVRVSAGDVKLAREFLEDSGCKVEDADDARLRVFNLDGRTQELTREALVMAAFRRLAGRTR